MPNDGYTRSGHNPSFLTCMCTHRITNRSGPSISEEVSGQYLPSSCKGACVLTCKPLQGYGISTLQRMISDLFKQAVLGCAPGQLYLPCDLSRDPLKDLPRTREAPRDGSTGRVVNAEHIAIFADGREEYGIMARNGASSTDFAHRCYVWFSSQNPKLYTQSGQPLFQQGRPPQIANEGASELQHRHASAIKPNSCCRKCRNLILPKVSLFAWRRRDDTLHVGRWVLAYKLPWYTSKEQSPKSTPICRADISFASSFPKL